MGFIKLIRQLISSLYELLLSSMLRRRLGLDGELESEVNGRIRFFLQKTKGLDVPFEHTFILTDRSLLRMHSYDGRIMIRRVFRQHHHPEYREMYQKAKDNPVMNLP